MNHSAFLVELIKGCNFQSYLELGVYIGETLVPITQIVSKAVGVDVKHHQLLGPANMYYGTTDEFFAQNTDKFDCIFIDADHSLRSVISDLRKSLDILNKSGVIILHDTNPSRKELLEDGYCSNCCLIHDLLDKDSTLNYVTLPFLDPGLTLITRKFEERYIALT